MDRRQVARVLEEVAAMLELAGENPFKVRAYERGAQAVLGFQGDFAEAVASGELLNVEGIGSTLFSHIETLAKTGSLSYHDELRARFPPGLLDCLRVPGVGARKAKLLYETLGIDSLEALERACREGVIASVKGFGPRTADRILKGIAMIQSSAGLHLHDRARLRAEELLAALSATRLASAIEIAGSLRRKKEIVRDIDLVAASESAGELALAFRRLPGVEDVTAEGPTKSSVRFADGHAADLRVVSAADFPAALLYFTGSQEHNTQLRGRARRMGLKLNEYGLFSAEGEGPRVECGSEAQIYAALGLSFIPPELREGWGETEAAERGEIPRLVEEGDLAGLIHIHTTDSDGRDSLEAMVAAARDAGYSYAAITDHSKTAAYAGGLEESRVLAQREEIRALRSRFPGFRIFHGTEADILADGSIDYGDEFLDGFDLVVASVHSRFGLPAEQQTRRLVRAVRNPRVSVLGHPSGRLLLSREPLAADWDAVLDAAAESGCAVEVNGNPERLDLDWRLCRAAVQKGIPIAIDPDAHSTKELELVRLGLGIARKGWVTRESALNAKSAKELERWLVRRRSRPLPD